MNSCRVQVDIPFRANARRGSWCVAAIYSPRYMRHLRQRERRRLGVLERNLGHSPPTAKNSSSRKHHWPIQPNICYLKHAWLGGVHRGKPNGGRVYRHLEGVCVHESRSSALKGAGVQIVNFPNRNSARYCRGYPGKRLASSASSLAGSM